MIAAYDQAEPGGSRVRLLAVASGGGHWDQLMQLRSVFDRFDTTYVSTNADLATRDGVTGMLVIPDANRNRPLDAARSLATAMAIVRRVRPAVVISTGALPGLFCLAAGRLHGARTIWLDSLANAEQLSMSGRMAGRFATLWLTQWEHMAAPGGPVYSGSLL